MVAGQRLCCTSTVRRTHDVSLCSGVLGRAGASGRQVVRTEAQHSILVPRRVERIRDRQDSAHDMPVSWVSQP